MKNSKSQQFEAHISAKEQLSEKVFLFDVQLINPPDIKFVPGQFVNIDVGSNVHRSYSIASPPSQTNKIELLVDIAPGGTGSKYFSAAESGDQITMNGPMGQFILESELGSIIFLAAGTGIAPFKSMIDHLIETQIVHDDPEAREIYLYISFRYEENIFWNDYFEMLERKYPNFHYQLTLSQPSKKWSGCQGYIQSCMDKQLLKNPQAHYYICGGNKMVQGVTRYLRTEKVPDDQTHFEPF